jgi:hypothetical protein
MTKWDLEEGGLEEMCGVGEIMIKDDDDEYTAASPA